MVSQRKPTNGIYHTLLLHIVVLVWLDTTKVKKYVFIFLNVKIVPVSLTECIEPQVKTSELPSSASHQGSETETHV